jgi:hypothetical protein
MSSSCIDCGGYEAYYDRISVEGVAASFTLQLKTGSLCRTCLDTTREGMQRIVDKLSADLSTESR